MIKNPDKYSYEELQTTITDLPPKTKRLAAFAYATGARASEINQIKKSDIRTEGNYLHITCPVLKKRNEIPFRIALVRLDEEWLIKPIQELLQTKQDTELLFPYSRITIWRLLSNAVIIKGDSFNPHGFRKVRATHLTTKFGFGGQQLKQFFDWSRSDMADRYVKLKTKDLQY